MKFLHIVLKQAILTGIDICNQTGDKTKSMTTQARIQLDSVHLA